MHHDRSGVIAARDWLLRHQPDEPVFFFAPARLRARAWHFLRRFPGQVTYAVKANPDPACLRVLVEAGVGAFDVASVAEMQAVRAVAPDAALHYHNPIRSAGEIAQARGFGVRSWSVDRASALDALGDIAGAQIAVRLRLPVSGAAYDFGAKFGADPDAAEALLRLVAARGGVPCMTFHPGTQCESAAPWAAYIAACAQIAQRAGVRLARLNVGGGFAAHRSGRAPDLDAVFNRIASAREAVFADSGGQPELVCEPGRAMVADAWQIALRVKASDETGVYLNDGVYGALSEWRDLPPGDRIAVFAADGADRRGAAVPRVVFGPTCDSLDRLPAPLPLPDDLQVGDYLLIEGMGAYSGALVTGFNGYGARQVVTTVATGAIPVLHGTKPTGRGRKAAGHRV
ncbi:type III PLP-dependent enzyme [Cognatishimia sp. F0-27]|uniref:type III PLP-dependent enzyme n=1 Tax=Cognatishimia sp. F0-27 TaxID=2816855 RepID=UPI001D0BFAFA|nr:type III PLP-dependent enzyme [Cognatishimia sp. F0-27]MCC1492503.1 alanine racemase [Cognatishimia sp. F0-27]